MAPAASWMGPRGVMIYGSLPRECAARRCRRVLLAVAANEIIIGGLSHSSSTAAWQSGWLFGDGGAVAAATAAVAAVTAG